MKAYEAYRESGVEWIGAIPRTWGILPIKRIARLCTDRADQQSFPVALENIQSWTGVFTESEATYEGEGVGFKVNDILFGKLRPYLAKVWLADRHGEAIGDFHVIRCLGKCHPDFLKRVLLTREIVSLIDGSTHGAKMPRAGWDFMGSIQIPLPSLEEQSAIAAFLDQETGKIDALVAEQERLIALLKEKRQAVISQAVTKGLNPNAPMKDSGIEWLGQVPAHWEVTPLKYIASFSGGGTPSREIAEFWGGEIPWVSPKDMKYETISDSEEKITGVGLQESASSLIQSDAVLLVVRSGILRHTIPVAVNICPVALNQDMKAIRLDEKRCLPQFLKRLIQGMNKAFLNQWLKQGATVESIEHNYLAGTPIPLAGLEEQFNIISFLDHETQKTDTLITEATQAITLLRERRAALISAAVTGKIDVHSLAPTKQEAA